MQLKTYQQTALTQLDAYLDALKTAVQDKQDLADFYAGRNAPVPDGLQNAPANAWNTLKKQGHLPAIADNGKVVIPDYIARTASCGEPIAHVCLKVPTGGGKTLLGVAALERLKTDRGFVLWIVPTTAIYAQTIKSFRLREHPYRQILERLCGGKVKLLEKTDRFSEHDVDNYLCVMLLMLPSATRQIGTDFLKIFRDSGGYESFFPEQDDAPANQQFLQQYPDLEQHEQIACVKQSLINVFKIIHPTVVLDEAHKAYGRNDHHNQDFVQAINRLNPRFVLELSATPKAGISNILVNISGSELHAEEMIKLPIAIHSFSNADWKRTLAAAQAKLDELEGQAQQLQAGKNRYIRPIALVRVQRTGRDQREQDYIHAEDARRYLYEKLNVPANQIRIQSSQQKELEGEDLLSEASTVRWIITKDALKEGWDCAFTYVLVLLDNTQANTAMTQLVGRILRQPDACKVQSSAPLNQCYIYCYNQDVGSAVQGVKQALESEGLSGLESLITGNSDSDSEPSKPITVSRRKGYGKLKIFLPQVLHKDGRKWRALDYDRDILSAVQWSKIDGGDKVALDDRDLVQESKAIVDIQGERDIVTKDIDSGEKVTLDYFVRRLDMIPNPWQAARVAEDFIKRHQCDDERLLNNRIYLAEVLRTRVQAAVDSEAEAVFRDKVGRNTIQFHLQTDKQWNYALERSFEVSVPSDNRTLQGKQGLPLQKSLFQPVYEMEFNSLEKDFALYMDSKEAIYWWHRIAARQGYCLQGWKRQRVYPDFVACQKGNGTLLIIEIKGKQLAGNEDTAYKQTLLEMLEKTYQNALERGELEICNRPTAKFRMLFEDTWQEDMARLV